MLIDPRGDEWVRGKGWMVRRSAIPRVIEMLKWAARTAN